MNLTQTIYLQLFAVTRPRKWYKVATLYSQSSWNNNSTNLSIPYYPCLPQSIQTEYAVRICRRTLCLLHPSAPYCFGTRIMAWISSFDSNLSTIKNVMGTVAKAVTLYRSHGSHHGSTGRARLVAVVRNIL